MFKNNDKFCDFPKCTNHALFYGMHTIKKETIDLCGAHWAAYTKAMHTGSIAMPELVCVDCGVSVQMEPGTFNQLAKLLDNRSKMRPEDPFFLCSKCKRQSGSWANVSCGKVILADYGKLKKEFKVEQEKVMT